MSVRCTALAVVAGAVLVTLLSGCQAPFGLGEPSTRALEDGVTGSLAAAKSFEIAGSYQAAGQQWSMDVQLVAGTAEHVVVTNSVLKLEALIFFDLTGHPVDGYFRGNQYLSQQMGTDPASRNLVKAAGNGWWKGPASDVPRLFSLTDGPTFRVTFLGTAVTSRTDHISVGGVEAVSLSGPRADVFVAAAAPHQLLRLHLKTGATIDGIADADFNYSNFGADFKIARPTDVIDFSDLSTLPPIYTVLSVDTSGCTSTCVVSALVKNLGGKFGAQAPSTITFTMSDSATKATIGTCPAQVVPDVGYNATKTVSCTIAAVNGQQANAATVTAVPTNPGRA
ncbi:MAG TPA: hypothetical protein VND96_15925 [Candidatus Micrarchaeaceae archaeon]|nr:hypothetical protein [Candidatus Micrarchaeaceae archaeon]